MATLETPKDLKNRLGETRLEGLVFAALKSEREGSPVEVDIRLASARLTRDASPETIAATGPWLESWRRHEADGHGILEITRKSFTVARNISIPKAFSFSCLDGLTSFLGGDYPHRTRQLKEFLERLGQETLPVPHSVTAWRAIYRATPEDLDCLLALMRWRANQDEASLADTALREVPVAELHTKWIEDHRGLVLSVFLDVGWAAADGGLSTRLGLAETDRGEVWARLHTAQTGINGQRLLNGYAPSEFIEAPAGVSRVLIVENRTTFDRLPVAPGTCLIFGSGKAILSYAAKMAWLATIEHITYWGDCDGAGYFILARLRRRLPKLRSIGMDMETVTAFQEHATHESPQEAVSGPLPELTPGEADARLYLHTRQRRLEQEYIPHAAIEHREQRPVG